MIYRVIRGGAFYCYAFGGLRYTLRRTDSREYRNDDFGFRLVVRGSP